MMSTRRLSVSNSLHSLNNSRRSSISSGEPPLELIRIGSEDDILLGTRKRGTFLRRSTLATSGLRNQSFRSLAELKTVNRRSTMDMALGLRKMKEDEKGRTNGKKNIEHHLLHRNSSSLVDRANTTANVRILPRELDVCNLMEKQMSLRSLEDREVVAQERYQKEQQEHTHDILKTKVRDVDATFHSIEERYSINIDDDTLGSLIKDVELRMKRKSKYEVEDNKGKSTQLHK